MKMGDTNKLVVVVFFSFVGVVVKKATLIVITFFNCFATKKTMAC